VISTGARQAWGELEARLRPFVARRVASPADVDDVLQNVLLRIQRGIGALRDDERFGPWVYRVARSAIVDHQRAQARRPVVPLEVEPLAAEDDAADRLEHDLAECVALFVARLPSPYREAVTLTELEGLPQKDAAEMLGISGSGMKSRVQRGRQKIREMFEQCCEVAVDCRGRVIDCTPRSLDEVPDDCRAAARAWAERDD
jgi:RNA polymerase sigma-70 factor (ECF subfamily)